MGGRRTVITPEKDTRLRELLREGKNRNQAALEMGVSNSLLIKWEERTGQKFTAGHQRITPEIDARLWALLREGKNQTQAALEIAFSVTSVKAWEKRNEVKFTHGRRVITPEKDARLRVLLREGKTKPEVVSETGISYPSIQKWEKRTGLKFRDPRRLTPEQDARLWALQRQGKTKMQARLELGLSYTCLLKWEERNEVKFAHGKKKITAYELEKLHFFAHDGVSMREAAKKMNIGYETVRRHVKRAGIKFVRGYTKRTKKLSESDRARLDDFKLSLTQAAKEKKTISVISEELGLDNNVIIAAAKRWDIDLPAPARGSH